MEGVWAAGKEVVAVERHVQLTAGHVGKLELLDGRLDALRQRRAARRQSDKHELFDPAVLFDDLVGHPNQRSSHLFGVHEDFIWQGRPRGLRDRAQKSFSPATARSYKPTGYGSLNRSFPVSLGRFKGSFDLLICGYYPTP